MSDYAGNHEKANVVTHLLGFVFGLIALPILVFKIAEYATSTAVDISGSIVYGIGFLMVFGFSTLYHAQKEPRKRRIMKIWDHISIYYLIAGTYTPFLLAFADSGDAKMMLYILWGLALFGTIFKVFFTGKYRLVSTLVYLAMGWMVVFSPESFKENLPSEEFFWIAVGGASYTVGVIFYLVKKIPFHHAIWHLFVLGGAICHYIGVMKIFT
ncbi:MAG: hemolysin III family protein [Flavobacteriales bacterium]|nr:hemolysin III family protein [Flavobacteriales bacterium]